MHLWSSENVESRWSRKKLCLACLCSPEFSLAPCWIITCVFSSIEYSFWETGIWQWGWRRWRRLVSDCRIPTLDRCRPSRTSTPDHFTRSLPSRAEARTSLWLVQSSVCCDGWSLKKERTNERNEDKLLAYYVCFFLGTKTTEKCAPRTNRTVLYILTALPIVYLILHNSYYLLYWICLYWTIVYHTVLDYIVAFVHCSVPARLMYCSIVQAAEGSQSGKARTVTQLFIF